MTVLIDSDWEGMDADSALASMQDGGNWQYANMNSTEYSPTNCTDHGGFYGYSHGVTDVAAGCHSGTRAWRNTYPYA